MRRRVFLIALVLVFALTMALPMQAMGITYKIVSCGNTGNGTTTTVTKTGNVVAKYKDYSTKVLEVETMLSKLGYDPGVVSKFFDYNTLLSVKKFQKANKLSVTGVVDQATYKKLKEEYAKLQEDDDDSSDPNPTVPGDNSGDNTGDNSGNGNDTGDTGNVSGLTAEEQQMVNLVNQERTSRGLPALKVDLTLVKTARMKSQDMINNNYFAHQSPTYGSPFDLMKSQGVSYRYAGENLAGAGSVTSAHTNLMNSSGHRANILNANYTHIGIGIISGGRYGKMFTQHFIGK